MIDSLILQGAELLVWMEGNVAVSLAIAAALLIPGLVCCWAARRGSVVSKKDLADIDRRLTQIYAAVELLTDTTESSLRVAFAEISRLSHEQRRATADDDLHSRMKTAARNGRTAREIAQSEGVSEGEVRLRLRLNGDDPDPGAKKRVLH